MLTFIRHLDICYSYLHHPFRSSSTLSDKSIDGRQMGRRKRMMGAVRDADVSFCSTKPSRSFTINGLMSWSILYVVEFCIRLLSKLESLSASSQMWSNLSSHLRGKQCRDNFYEYMWQLQEEYVQGVVLSHWKFERRFRYPKDCRRTDTSSFSLLSGLRFEISSH